MTTATQTNVHAPPLPRWEDVALAAQRRAQQWCAALAPVLERNDSPFLSRAEVEQLAVDATARTFGQAMSARHVRRMMTRVIERDAGRRQWHRPELYLEQNPPRAVAAVTPRLARDLLEDLKSVAEDFHNPAQPTPAEEARFLQLTWLAFTTLRERGVKPKKAKADLCRFLWDHARWLSDTYGGLSSKLARKFNDYETSGEIATFQDGRTVRKGEARAPAIPEADIVKIGSYTTFVTGKRLAQAKRELMNLGENSGITAETLKLMDAGKSKSYVNRRLAAAVLPRVRAAAPHVLRQGSRG